MNYIEEIRQYKPINEQENVDKEVILDYAESFSHNILLRENRLAHMTASAVIVNKEHTKMLMIHHNIYNTWTWVGGHADGEVDMLKLALKEATEETGVKEFKVLGNAGAVDILLVNSHIKKGKYICPHLHLNVSYVFEANENHGLIVNEEETSGLKWVSIDEVPSYSNEKEIYYVYGKLFDHANITKKW